MSLDIHRCRFLDYNPSAITSLSFTTDSSTKTTASDVRLAVGRGNGNIEIWNPRHNWIHEITIQGGRERSVEALAWIINDDEPARLFSIGGSTSVTEWDLNTCLPINNYLANAGVIWSLAASPDNKKLAIGCDDGSVIILDVSGGRGSIEQQRILQRQTSRVLCLAWNGNDQIIGGLADARICVWSTLPEANGKILSVFKTDKSKYRESTLVWAIKTIGNDVLVSGDSTGSVKFWDLKKFSLLQSFSSHEADVLSLAVNTAGTTVYSAGVDRKIMCYQIVNKHSGRWAPMGSTLDHTHDIRALALHESSPKNNILVSGGVETYIVVNNLNTFLFGSHKKISYTPQKPCVSSLPSKRLVMMWEGQTVKIWHLGKLSNLGDEESNQYVSIPVKGQKLISRITLSSDENITSAALSPNGRVLAVSTIAETKLFQLTPVYSDEDDYDDEDNITSLKVKKLTQYDLEEEGAKSLHFIEKDDQLKLLIHTPESELLIFSLNYDKEVEEYGLDMERRPFELNISDSKLAELGITPKKKKSTLGYLDSISLVKVSPKGDLVTTSTFNGIVALYDISKIYEESHSTEDEEESNPTISGIVLGNFTVYPTAFCFTELDTLVVVTAEIRVFEYSIIRNGSELRAELTPWAKTNAELLPQELSEAKDKCRGIFYIPGKSRRLWLWSGSWVAFLDTSVDIPVKRIPKRQASGQFNQHYGPNDGLGLVADEDVIMEDLEQDKSKSSNKRDNKKRSNKATTNGSKNTELNINDNENSSVAEVDDSISMLGRQAFWVTYKYHPILYAGPFGPKEMVIAERPRMSLKLPPAFWSNHKVSF